MYKDPLYRYLPESSVKAIVDVIAVEVALPRIKNENSKKDELVEFICGRSPRIFAILICMEAEDLIECFYENNFDDSMLPVIEDLDDEGPEGVNSAVTRLKWLDPDPESERINTLRRIFNTNAWKTKTRKDFCDRYQWQFLSPVFRGNQFRYKFHDKYRMPFMDDRGRDQKISHFSVVEKWQIHRDHLQIESRVVSCIPVEEVRRLLNCLLRD